LPNSFGHRGRELAGRPIERDLEHPAHPAPQAAPGGYVILDGNPPDAAEFPASLDHHQVQFGHPPHTTAADRAFSTTANEQYAAQAGVQCVGIPHAGKCSVQRRAWEQRPAFRRAARFRAGIEGRISVLKRRFGLRRCRYHGRTGDGALGWLGHLGP
jgi:IS5 family transposase